MKILCVAPVYWPAFIFGGPIFSVHAMNKALVAKGEDITVYTTYAGLAGKVPLNTEVDVDGVKVTYFPHWKLFDFFTSVGWHFSPVLSKTLKKKLSSFDVVYIVGVWNYPSIISALYCRKQKIPFIVSPRGSLYPFTIKNGLWKKMLLYKMIIKNNFNLATGVHYTTEDEAEKCHASLKLESNVFVVPLGIDLREFDSLPGRSVLEEFYPQIKGKKVILFLGRINWKKGLDLLVKAYANLTKERDDVHLLIAGNDETGYKAKVRAWVNDFDIAKKVTFMGMINGKKKLAALTGSDVFVLPSYSENFGMAVLEAMAAGLAVVISDQVAIHGDITEYQAGVVVNCEVSSLENGISKVLNDDVLRKKMKENATKLVKDKFSLDRTANNAIEMFNQAIITR